MLKPFTLSVSLAAVLGACSLSFAGGHKIFASGQEVAPTPQSTVPSAQSIGEGCGDVCGPVKKHFSCDFLSKFKPKPATYTYEWVLKKKKVHNWGHGTTGGCDSCGTTLPSGQYPSSQSYGSSQVPTTYSAPQAGYSMPQAGTSSAPQIGYSGGASAPASGSMAPTEPPAAPVVPETVPAVPSATTPPTASNGGLQLLPAGN